MLVAILVFSVLAFLSTGIWWLLMISFFSDGFIAGRVKKMKAAELVKCIDTIELKKLQKACEDLYGERTEV